MKSVNSFSSNGVTEGNADSYLWTYVYRFEEYDSFGKIIPHPE